MQMLGKRTLRTILLEAKYETVCNWILLTTMVASLAPRPFIFYLNEGTSVTAFTLMPQYALAAGTLSIAAFVIHKTWFKEPLYQAHRLIT
jgi:hypothetical protein